MQAIEGFRIERELGRGAMGVVYLAIEERLERPVALKVLDAEYARMVDTAKERFLNEARRMARLAHQGVVRIYRCDLSPSGEPFLALEFIDGDPLHVYLAKRPMGVLEAVDLLCGIADALGELHAAGLVHRDLKPSNIFLRKNGSPVIGDFGVARDVRADKTFTAKGAIVGTALYMSTEQANGEIATPASDIYSLGAIAYELIARTTPFTGSALDVLVKHVSAEPKPLAELAPRTPQPLVRLVHRMLSKNPSDRPADGKVALAELRQVRNELEGGATIPFTASPRAPKPRPIARASDPERIRSIDARFDRELYLGNARAAVELVCEGWEAEPIEVSHWMTRAELLARELRIHGALFGLDRLRESLREIFAFGRWSLPPEVEALWHREGARDGGCVGSATFPISCRDQDGVLGTVREIRVGGAPGRHVPMDSAFGEAVERARGAAKALVGPAPALENAPWSLVPDIPVNRGIEGSSVGLAAFVAFVSKALGEPAPDRFAFTGVVGRRWTEFEPVAKETLEAKRQVLRERPYVRSLLAPGHEGDGIRGETDTDEIARAVFGRSIVPSNAAAPRAPVKSLEVELRVRAVLRATVEPLSVRAIHGALSSNAWRSAAPLEGRVLEEVLEDLRMQSLAGAALDGSMISFYRAAKDLEHSDQIRDEDAHRALATLEVLSAWRPYHAWCAGDREDARRALASLIADRGAAGIALAVRVLVEVARRSSAEAWSLGEALETAPSAHAPLAYAAYACERLPSLYVALGRRLVRAETSADRLLWLQAVVETTFHLFAACSIASAPSNESRRRDLSVRPNLGQLLDEARTFCDAFEGARPLAGAMKALGAAVAPFNELIHRVCKWHLLAGEDAELLDATSAEIARKLNPVLFELIDFFAQHPLSWLGEDGAILSLGGGGPVLTLDARGHYALKIDAGRWIDLSGQLVPMADTDVSSAAFYRGVVRGDVRYWCFSSAEVRYAPRPPGFEAEELLSDRARRMLAAVPARSPEPVFARVPRPEREVRVQAMPVPLARAWIDLRKALREMDLIRALGAIDLAVECVIRFPWFVLAPSLIDREHPQKDGPWISRPTKRALLDALRTPAARSAPGFGPLADLLAGGALSEPIDALIDTLERLEHAPGPLSDQAPAVRRAAERLEHILSEVPWEAEAADLVARPQAERAVSFKGVSPSAISPRSVEGVAVGEVQIVRGGARWPLWPFAVAAPEPKGQGALFMFAYAKGRGPLARFAPTYLALDGRGRVSFRAVEWMPDPNRPLEIGVNLRAPA